MKLIFVSSERYPNGGAAVNRHLAYAKGLNELGHDITFLLLENQEWTEKRLVKDNIEFIQVNQIRKSKFRIQNIINLYKIINNAKHQIEQERAKLTRIAVVLLDTDILILNPTLFYLKNMGIKTFHERTEYPAIVAGKSLTKKIKLFIYLHYTIRKFDGIYVINKALKNYFQKITNERIPIRIINMIVDPSRFEDTKSIINSNIISYCGTIEGEKDGVPILIQAFRLIADEFQEIKLQLIGSLENKRTREKITAMVEELGLKNRVILTGLVNRGEIPGLLSDSRILALARPNNKQAEGGFPTKLGEYLATGNVVVVTSVGEIGEFLTDKKNAFIASPGSAEKFAAKLREALLSKDGSKIGLEGKKLVYDKFNYLTQARELEKMFFQLI